MASEPGIDSLRLLASRVLLNRITIDEIPNVAQDLLEEGLDTPSLRVLAVLLPIERERIRPLFQRVLSKSGVEPPSTETAALLVADEIAAGMVRGAIRPDEGCFDLVGLCRRADYINELLPFVQIEDLCSVVPAERAVFEREAIDEAKAYLERRRTKKSEPEVGG